MITRRSEPSLSGVPTLLQFHLGGPLSWCIFLFGPPRPRIFFILSLPSASQSPRGVQAPSLSGAISSRFLSCFSSLGLSPCRLFGSKVEGSGFRVQGSGFRVQGSGFRDWRPRVLPLLESPLLRLLCSTDPVHVGPLWSELAHIRQSSPGSGLGFQLK